MAALFDPGMCLLVRVELWLPEQTLVAVFWNFSLQSPLQTFTLLTPDGAPTRLMSVVGASSLFVFCLTPFKVWQHNYLRLSL